MRKEAQVDELSTTMIRTFRKHMEPAYRAFCAALRKELPVRCVIESSDNFEDEDEDAEKSYGVGVVLRQSDAHGELDVWFRLTDSPSWDGTDDGWNVLIQASAWGGEVGPGYCPYNYTPRVWTKDPEEIRRRIKAFDPIRFAKEVALFYGRIRKDRNPSPPTSEEKWL